MPQVKKLYGLVYNTDGSLCVTYRDDDIPFAGVRSFAVEEATTNLSPQTVNGWQGISLVYKGEENGWKKYGISGTWNSGTYPYCAAIGPVSFTGGEYYSTSAFFKTNCQEKFATYFEAIKYVNAPIISDGTTIRRIASDGSIYLARNGFAYVDSTSQSGFLTLRPKQDGETFNPDQHFLYVKNIQTENKPFATSYVDGSRPNGYMYIPANDLDTKSYTLEDGSRVKLFNNHVISLWFKVPKVQPNEINSSASVWQVLQQIVGNHYDLLPTNHRYRQWGIAIFAKTGHLFVSAPFLGFGHGVDHTVLASAGTFEDVWHNLVFTFNVLTESSTEIIREHKVYYDGEHVKSTTYNLYPNTGSWGNSFINDNLYFYEDTYNRSNLVSNIFIGKYRKPNGEIIWTDDYIREVYEAQIPFPVSNKLSIY